MNITVQPIPVATEEGEGLLVFAEGRLAAVLVRLSELHEDMAGRWFLEAVFGLPDRRASRVFDDLDAAQDWIARALAQPVWKAPSRAG